MDPRTQYAVAQALVNWCNADAQKDLNESRGEQLTRRQAELQEIKKAVASVSNRLEERAS